MDNNRDKLRKLYGTPDGRPVLMDLLNDLKFFDILESEADMVLHNKALVLLSKLGIWEEHNITRIVNALMNMPYMNEGENDG